MVTDLKDSNSAEVQVQQGESCNITATLTFDGSTFAKAAILTLLLTLYDKVSGAIINSRSRQDILDVNGSSVATDGTVTIELDSSLQTFTATAGTDLINATAHGLSDGDKIWFYSSDTLPAGVPTTAFVITSTANTFQIAATSGGTAIDLTSTGSGTHTFIAGDNVMVGSNDLEQHIARIEWTWNDGNSVRRGREELAFQVERQTVPTDPT